MKVLVVGGCGYIGSHTVVELLKNGEEVIVVDNFSNSKRDVLDKIKKITGKEFSFYEVDATDREGMRTIFEKEKIDSIIHFAGYKAVGESVSKPVLYYRNNLLSTIVLLEMMETFGVKQIVFSSSATVYGSPEELPIKETARIQTTNPYGETKVMCEKIISDFVKVNPGYEAILLRYFNPIGADESGLIGENPNGIPNNLMPYIVKVANHELECLHVFGNDYDTPDGTGVRDYVHVTDLAHGHILALMKALEPGVHIYNLGTGEGYSVLDIVQAFERANGVNVPYVIEDRRPGDIASCYADITKAKEELGYVPEKTLEDMCRSAWNFVQKDSEGRGN